MRVVVQLPVILCRRNIEGLSRSLLVVVPKLKKAVLMIPHQLVAAVQPVQLKYGGMRIRAIQPVGFAPRSINKEVR